MGRGYLKINLYLADDALPVGNAKVLVKGSTGTVIYDLNADENGITETVGLDAPDENYSLEPYSPVLCFSIYDIEVPAVRGFKKVIIHGVQIFDTETAILPIQMHPAIIGNTPDENTDIIFIPISHGVDEPDTRFQSSRPRQARGGRGPALNRNGSNTANPGGIVAVFNSNGSNTADPDDGVAGYARPTSLILANEVRIPYNITVHLGSPNAAAQNVRLPFIDYIKNVASSEIFPTWEESALYANIYCQISFALNRVYTTWYRSRGFDYEITNDTAFDQAFVNGRNIFENISRIVDGIFNMFLRRQGRREPFFAQYCNGTTSTCNGLSQWGSQALAQNNYTPIEILHYYFPNDIQIVESNNFTADVGSYGGVPLKEGSSGEDVQTMQIYLNRISGNFYITPVGVPDGFFRSSTSVSVIDFQTLQNLIADGIIGKSTWYTVTKIYVAVKQLAELESEGERIGIGRTPPNVILRIGSRGPYVIELQFLINFISNFFPTIPFQIGNGVYSEASKRGVVAFQQEFGLTADGIVGPVTWSALYNVYWSIQSQLQGDANAANTSG